MRRREFLGGLALSASAIALAGESIAQPLAGKQIRVVVPFPAGGPTDIVARPLAQMLGDALGATMIVDNRGGAGGSIGADAVAKAAPDGQTLLVATVGTHAINATLLKNLPYDPVRDFTPLALVATGPVAVVVHPSLPAKDLAALVRLAKESPGKLNYGSAGAGSPGHLTGEMFKAAAGIDIQHVPYKGSAPAVTDLIAGQIQIMFDPLQSVFSNIQGGKLRPLAVSSAARASILANVPTVAEAGYPGFETTAWWGVFAPAGVPGDVAAALADALEKVVRGDAFRSKLEPLGVVPSALTGPAFAAFQKREIEKWGKAVRDSGAKVE